MTPKGPLWVSGAWAHSARGLSVCRITPSPLSSEEVCASCIWPLGLPGDHSEATKQSALFSLDSHGGLLVSLGFIPDQASV